MPRASKSELVAAAIDARKNAYAPYSKFKVGAAVLTKSGKVFAGVNVENASFGLTCCAERVAIFKSVSVGERDFFAIAVVARIKGGPMPCGACRQVLHEFAPKAKVWVADTKFPSKVREFAVEDLLPEAFGEF